MNKTLKTFLRSTADTGSVPKAMVMFLPQQGEASVRATVVMTAWKPTVVRLNGVRVEGKTTL